MLYDLGKDYTGFDFSAMIDDAKIGMKHLTSWDRVALVSDHSMINELAKFYGLLFFASFGYFRMWNWKRQKNGYQRVKCILFFKPGSLTYHLQEVKV